jgi:hypothetical protein
MMIDAALPPEVREEMCARQQQQKLQLAQVDAAALQQMQAAAAAAVLQVRVRLFCGAVGCVVCGVLLNPISPS